MISECRMYCSEYPEVDEVIMVQVKRVAEMGAYVQLLEYNNIEGMILLSELTRRRIRSVSKLIKVGRIEPVMVLRVDKEKGYIDLSKRRVSSEDIQKCEDKYNKSKMVHSIMRHVSETTGANLEDLYKNLGWPLYETHIHAFNAFKCMVTDPDLIFLEISRKNPEFIIDASVKRALLKDISRRMTPQPLKIRADVELTCFEGDGIENIKDAMRKAELVSTELCKIKVSLVASPLYVITTQTLEKERGIDLVEAAIQAAQECIHQQGGRLILKENPRVVSERDDRLLTEKTNNNGTSSEEDSDTSEEK
jgi:translation initiation factor 2 subunit 1